MALATRPGDFWLTSSQVLRLIEGIQESLAGCVCLLHMPLMSQAEICGVPATPFVLDLEALSQRVKERPVMVTPALYQRMVTFLRLTPV